MPVTQTIAYELRTLWSEGRGKLLLMVAVPWGLILGARMIYPVLLPDLRAAFDLSFTAAGLLITVLWLFGALGQLPGGVIADRRSERRVLAVAVLLVSIALALVAIAPTASVLFTATAVWGLGHSLYPIARITVLTDLYPNRVGSSLGVVMATGDIGQTALPPLAGVIAVLIGWQFGLGFLVPFLAVSGVLIWVRFPDLSPDESAVDTLSMETARYVFDVIKQPVMVFMSTVMFLYSIMWQAFTAFYPTYLIVVKGLSPSVAAGLFGLFFAIGVFIKPIAGAAYDRLGVRLTLFFILVTPVVGLLILPFVAGFWPLLVVTILVSTLRGSGAITQSFLAEMFPRDMRGSGLGTVRSTVFTLGAAGPVLFGALADRGFFDEAYLALAVVIVVILFILVRMPEASTS